MAKIYPSRFESLHSTKPTPTTWEDIVEEIRSEKHRPATERYQVICHQLAEAETEELKAQKTALKQGQPAFIPSVVLQGDGRSAANIAAYTGVIMVDLDDIAPELFLHTLATVRHDPHGFLVHTTMSGAGIRVLCPVDVTVTKDNFGTVWQLVNDYYARLTGIAVDKQCKNATRMSVICHDPEVLYRPDAPPLPVATTLKALTEQSRKSRRKVGRPVTAERAEAVVKRLIEEDGVHYESGRHNDYICRCLYWMNRFGVNEGDAQAWALREFSDYDATHHSVAATVRSCYARASEHRTEELARWERKLGLSASAKSNAGRPSNKATVEEMEAFVRGWGEFRFNRLINQLEYRLVMRDEGLVINDEGLVINDKCLAVSNATNHSPLTTNPSSLTTKHSSLTTNHWLRMSDQTENSLWRAMQHAGLEVDVFRIRTLLQSDFVPDYHPLQEYLSRLTPWDGVTDYIGQVSRRVHCRGTSPEEFDFYFRRWFVGILAGALRDDVVNNVIFVLLGPQGIFKTSFMNRLLPPELRRYYTIKTNSQRMTKDDAFALTENLLINFEELDSMQRSELNQLKALCTADYINDRPAYGRNKVRLPHVASFCGTGNNLQFLTDDTGNRRWLPFEVERIDNPWDTTLPYAGMYAQAKALLDSDFCYWFIQPEVDALNDRNRRFEVPNPARELILMYYRKPTELEKAKKITASQIVARWGSSIRLNAVQVGKALRELGFEQIRSKHGNIWLVEERKGDEINDLLPDLVVSEREKGDR